MTSSASTTRPGASGPDPFERRPTAGLALCGLFSLATTYLLVAQSGRIFPLNWGWGDIRIVLLGLAVVSGALTLLCWWARRPLDRFLRRRFRAPRKLVFPAFLSVASTAAVLGALELFMRMTGRPFTHSWSQLELELSEFDDELGWVYRASQSLVQRGIPLHFDEIGARIRSPEHRPERGEPAVLFVGGSYTFGHGLPFEECFVGRVEASGELPYEVVNLGVQAYGTDQALLRLKRHFHDYDTRLVVYTYIVNHVARNRYEDRRILFPHARFLGTKPRFGLRDGKPVLEHLPTRFEDYEFSRLLARAQMARIQLGPPLSTELTRALIAEMGDFSRANGARFMVVNWVQSMPIYGALDPDARPMEGLGIPVLDPSLGAPPDWCDWRIPGDGHPDARAHRRVAELLLPELQSPIADEPGR